MKKPSEAAKKAKAKELFTLSHKLLDAAKQLSEHHAAELRYNMQQAMDAAKTAAQKDMKQLHKFRRLRTKMQGECHLGPLRQTQSRGRVSPP